MKTRKKSQKKTLVDSIRSFLAREVASSGFTVYPSTFDRVEKHTKRAEAKGLIENDRELAICESALILAAVEQARIKGIKKVRVKELSEGWEMLSQGCPGNTPPHQCMKRSIIDVGDQLRDRLPGFDRVVGMIDHMELEEME